jgi:hypothetical protein
LFFDCFCEACFCTDFGDRSPMGFVFCSLVGRGNFPRPQLSSVRKSAVGPTAVCRWGPAPAWVRCGGEAVGRAPLFSAMPHAPRATTRSGFRLTAGERHAPQPKNGIEAAVYRRRAAAQLRTSDRDHRRGNGQRPARSGGRVGRFLHEWVYSSQAGFGGRQGKPSLLETERFGRRPPLTRHAVLTKYDVRHLFSESVAHARSRGTRLRRLSRTGGYSPHGEPRGESLPCPR